MKRATLFVLPFLILAVGMFARLGTAPQSKASHVAEFDHLVAQSHAMTTSLDVGMKARHALFWGRDYERLRPLLKIDGTGIPKYKPKNGMDDGVQFMNYGTLSFEGPGNTLNHFEIVQDSTFGVLLNPIIVPGLDSWFWYHVRPDCAPKLIQMLKTGGKSN